jgi:hypothetical protein
VGGLCAQVPGGRLGQPAARARDHDDFAFDVSPESIDGTSDRAFALEPLLNQ